MAHSTMYCWNCGRRTGETDRYCAHCGSALEAPDTAAPALVAPAPAASTTTEGLGGPVLHTAAGAFALAGFGVRLGGYLIDAAVGFVAGLAISALGAALFADAGGDAEAEAVLTDPGSAIGLLVALGALWVFNALGWTPGKRALGLRIVRDDGRPPGAGDGLARTLGALASGTALGLGYLWAAWDGKRQTWHDKMAATYVVRLPR